jgi:DNA-binding GntR family transcriptional regulator
MPEDDENKNGNGQKDVYALILDRIDRGSHAPGTRMVESDLAEKLEVSRTPIREALQRLETQGLLMREGRSLMVASLDHDQMGELYAVRSELEGLAARLAAQHATPEEIRVLYSLIEEDRAFVSDPQKLSRANKRFHRTLHHASHNRYLVQQLEMVHRNMVLMANTSLAAEGRGTEALEEHHGIVKAIEDREGDAAYKAMCKHLSAAYETRLKREAGSI